MPLAADTAHASDSIDTQVLADNGPDILEDILPILRLLLFDIKPSRQGFLKNHCYSQCQGQKAGVSISDILQEFFTLSGL